MTHEKQLIPFLLTALFGGATPAHAADVPDAGTKLAPEQTLVKGNGLNPPPWIPRKWKVPPESNVLRDLFEGLVSSGPKGETLPGVAESWETKDNKHYVFHLRKGCQVVQRGSCHCS